MIQSMVTTIDNPFNPFTQIYDWYDFDESQGYHTTSYLARIAKTSDELSQRDNDLAVEQAIDEIVKLNVLGIYKKVYMEEPDDDEETELLEEIIE